MGGKRRDSATNSAQPTGDDRWMQLFAGPASMQQAIRPVLTARFKRLAHYYALVDPVDDKYKDAHETTKHAASLVGGERFLWTALAALEDSRFKALKAREKSEARSRRKERQEALLESIEVATEASQTAREHLLRLAFSTRLGCQRCTGRGTVLCTRCRAIDAIDVVIDDLGLLEREIEPLVPTAPRRLQEFREFRSYYWNPIEELLLADKSWDTTKTATVIQHSNYAFRTKPCPDFVKSVGDDFEKLRNRIYTIRHDHKKLKARTERRASASS